MTNCVLWMCQIGRDFVCIRSASRFSLSRASEGGLFLSLHLPLTLHFAGPHKAQGGEGAMPGSPTSSRGRDYLCQLHPAAQTFPFSPILHSSSIHNAARVWAGGFIKWINDYEWKWRKRNKLTGISLHPISPVSFLPPAPLLPYPTLPHAHRDFCFEMCWFIFDTSGPRVCVALRQAVTEGAFATGLEVQRH